MSEAMSVVNGEGGSRTLGPLDRLEQHWPGKWGELLFSADPVAPHLESHQQWLRSLLELLPHLDLRQDHRVLDAACATGSRCLEFAQRGIRRIWGADFSAKRIETARRRAEEAGWAIEFHALDRPPRFPFPRGVRFDRALLLANSLAIGEQPARQLLEQIAAHLSQDGQLLLEVADGNWLRTNFVPRSWHWVDQHHFVCHERALAEDGMKLICREVLIHTEQGITADQIYTESLQPLEEILSLLQQAGFRVARQQHLEPGRRILLAAHKATTMPPGSASPADPTPVSGTVRQREITVLLGDPTRPDETKRGGIFNPDDLAVVDKLRENILSLQEFRFTFLDHHDSLLAELQRNRPGLVLNFCDEGYRNLPTMELHVPAVLEMLGIPYSGSGPACLARCYDKFATSCAARDLGIPTPREVYCPGAQPPAGLPGDFPLLVKPNFGDGSFGITKESVVRNREELTEYLANFRRRWPGQPALVQEFLSGREFTVALLGNPGQEWRFLPVVEADFRKLPAGLPRICGFESKEVPDNPYWEEIEYPRAELTPADRERIYQLAIRLFEGLHCRDYARFDFREDASGTLKLIDANPNPGYNYLGYMAELEHSSYPEVLRWLINTAVRRLA